MLKEVEAVDIIYPQLAALRAAAEVLRDCPDLDFSSLDEPIVYGNWVFGRRIGTYEQQQPFILLIPFKRPDKPTQFENAFNFFKLNGYSPNGACEPELIGKSLSPTLIWPKNFDEPLLLQSDEQRSQFGIKLPQHLNPRYKGTMVIHKPTY